METKITKSTAKKGISAANKRYLAKLYSKLSIAVFSLMALFCTGITAFAADGDGVTNDAGSFDTVVGFIVTWVQRIGYVIGFLGAIQFGLAFKNDDADGKQRGLMTLASGFIVIAICIAYDQLFASAV